MSLDAMGPGEVAIARVVCEAANGREGCSCKRGRACESLRMVAWRVANALNISQADLNRLADGTATIRAKPQRKSPSMPGPGNQQEADHG